MPRSGVSCAELACLYIQMIIIMKRASATWLRQLRMTAIANRGLVATEQLVGAARSLNTLAKKSSTQAPQGAQTFEVTQQAAEATPQAQPKTPLGFNTHQDLRWTLPSAGAFERRCLVIVAVAMAMR